MKGFASGAAVEVDRNPGTQYTLWRRAEADQERGKKGWLKYLCLNECTGGVSPY